MSARAETERTIEQVEAERLRNTLVAVRNIAGTLPGTAAISIIVLIDKVIP